MRPLVSPAVQVREMHAARASYGARLHNLVSVRIAEEAARREYMLYAPRGDEEAGGGPREGQIAAEDSARGNRGLLDDGLGDLGVRVTALVQRAAWQSTAACRSCQLSVNALALPVHLLVLKLR